MCAWSLRLLGFYDRRAVPVCADPKLRGGSAAIPTRRGAGWHVVAVRRCLNVVGFGLFSSFAPALRLDVAGRDRQLFDAGVGERAGLAGARRAAEPQRRASGLALCVGGLERCSVYPVATSAVGGRAAAGARVLRSAGRAARST